MLWIGIHPCTRRFVYLTTRVDMIRRMCLRAVALQSHAPLSCGSFSVCVDKRSSHRHASSPRLTGVRHRPSSPVNRTPTGVRVHDKQTNVLLSKTTPSNGFVVACRALRDQEETALLATTDPRTWNVALRHRLEIEDEQGAAALLGLVASFARENASEPVWTDLLFTVLRQRSSCGFCMEEVQELVDQLKKRYGPQFVAKVLIGVVNGCANIRMLVAAHELLLYQQTLWSEIREMEGGLSLQEPLMPPSIVGHLMTKMTQKKKYRQVLELATVYFARAAFDASRDFQQQGFLKLFEASVKTQQSPRTIVRTFLDYVDGKVRDSGGDLDNVRRLVLERGFGAAMQCCVALEEFSLVLQCYQTMGSIRAELVDGRDDGELEAKVRLDNTTERVRIVDAVLPADENMCVNVMKACMAVKDSFTFKKVFREMAARGVARSAGFGLAIRYCHKHLDPTFLEEVLDEVFLMEQELAGAWMLEVENYNDALGCFAATNRPDQAKELFANMLNNPFIVPDHITMLEMVENHRDAAIEEIFNLLDVFLEWKLTPNLQVFTSLLSICMRQRIVGDAVALINAMEKQGVVPDVKLFTTIAFIHASHGDVKAVVRVLRDMAHQSVATDRVFFDYVINALYGSRGIDMCFSLFSELSQDRLAIPEGLYVSLVDLGTKTGLIERTLHVAYNMECEGFQLSPEQLHELMMRCQSYGEISEFVRTFSLLHQGLQPETPRFEIELYEDLVSVLTQFNCKNEVSRVQELARTAGHNDLIV